MSFELGSAVKYIWRCDQKGDAIENLEKAIECITEEIAMRKEAAGTGRELATDEALHEIALGWWP